jgi:hypothetical protein
MDKNNYRRYYLHKRAKQVTEASLNVKNRSIEVSYTIDATGVL